MEAKEKSEGYFIGGAITAIFAWFAGIMILADAGSLSHDDIIHLAVLSVFSIFCIYVGFRIPVAEEVERSRLRKVVGLFILIFMSLLFVPQLLLLF